jgi:cell division initiation protein
MKEAEIIVAAAEVQAEKTLQEAEARRADLSTEITQMQHIRRQVEVELRRTLEGYLNLIDTHQSAQAPADPSPGAPSPEANADGT